MKNTSTETERNKRLAVAAFLRDTDGHNKERISHVHSILTGQPLPQKDYLQDPTTNILQNEEEKAFWRSFRLRCIVALLLATGIYLGSMINLSQITPYINKIKAEIVSDYSENLFDFIEQIPYTLEYEKINVEG